MLIIGKIMLVFCEIDFDFRLTYVALISALPVILLSQSSLRIVKNIDWSTPVFFLAMFILMVSVWNSGCFQKITESTRLNMSSRGTIMGVSILLSQPIPNVPLLTLYLPVMSSVFRTRRKTRELP